jgi:predicted dehydrogenase
MSMSASTSKGQERSLQTSRRDFLVAGGIAGAGALALMTRSIPAVHAAESHTIRLALIGCGGRGSGAVKDAFSVANGPVELYAMADIFEDRLESSRKVLSEMFGQQVNVEGRCFVGFDAYKHAIDCLRPGDVAMLTGYAAFRPMQLEYAISKGVNVFMEKSFACDPVGVRRVIAAGKKAEEKNVKIAAGLQCRHSVNRQELIRRIKDGELGDIISVRAYRMEAVGPLGPKPADVPELFWQIRNFFRFFWVSGGLFSEMDIHQIDEICWIKDAWPVRAHGVGGRAVNSTDRSQNLDSYFAEWTFPDGTQGIDVVRYVTNCYNHFATYIHGSKRAAQFSGSGHAGIVRIFKDQRIEEDNILWEAPKEKLTPWQAEWADLFDSIRNDKPHNEAERAALANLAAIIGRAAVHSGQIVTWEEAVVSEFQFCPNIDQMTAETPPPIQPDERGFYPVPVPGQWKEI